MNYSYSEYSLYDELGRRKYLTTEERARFYSSAGQEEQHRRLFALVLLFTGCRISEALELDENRINPRSSIIIIRTLKKHRRRSKTSLKKRVCRFLARLFRKEKKPSKRKDVVNRQYRAVVVPPKVIAELNAYFNLEEHRGRLWPINRRTGYRWVKKIMKRAKIDGIHACPKGLRHGFANSCWEENVTPVVLQHWMGHSSLATTMIYSKAVDQEEMNMAERTWRRILS